MWTSRLWTLYIGRAAWALAASVLSGWCHAEPCPPAWLSGPEQGGTGARGAVLASMMWDASGTGTGTPTLVVAGEFASIGTCRTNIARLDGSNWVPIGSGANGPIRALTVFRGELVAAGQFSRMNGVSCEAIARFDGSQWRPLATGVDGAVYAMAEHAGSLYIGGSFSVAGSSQSPNIARWDGAAWHSVGSGANAPVEGLASYQGGLIAVGGFTTLGGASVPYVGAWNGSSWRSMPGGPTYTASAVLVMGNELIIGGAFSNLSSVPGTSGVAAWNGSSWRRIGKSGEFRGSVRALATNGTDLYIGGYSAAVNGVDANRAARWNGMIWSPLAGGIDQGVSKPGSVATIAIAPQGVFYGGPFYFADGTDGANLALWSDETWRSFGSGVSQQITELYELNGVLFAAGNFLEASNQRVSGVARWTGGAWEPVAPAFDQQTVTALGSHDNALVVSGYFVDGKGNASTLVTLEDGHWRPFTDAPFGAVYALAEFRGRLVAGGNFTATFDGRPLGLIAAWNGERWEQLGGGLEGLRVEALAVHENELFASGLLTTAGGQTVQNIARWNGSRWSSAGEGLENYVGALVEHNGVLFAGGRFLKTSGPAACVARWTGSGWSIVGDGMFSSRGIVLDLASVNGDLIACGDFDSIGSATVRDLARWDGSAWNPLASSVAGEVFAVAAYRGELAVGGRFSVMDELVATNFARWAMSPRPWFSRSPTSVAATCGQVAVFEAKVATGYGDLSYQWRRDGIPLDVTTNPSATTPRLMIAVARDTVGSYDCIAINSCSYGVSEPAALTMCLADLDCNGLLNNDDVDAFMGAFEVGSPSADFNSDGFLTFEDFDAFVSAFESGC